MPSYGEGESDLFFDSFECLSGGEPAMKDELGCAHLDYEIWLQEPQSVEARRRGFYSEMNLLPSEVFGLERIVESSDAVSLSSSDCNSSEEGGLVCCGREEHGSGANVMFDKVEAFADEPNEEVHSRELERGKVGNGHVVWKKKMESWWKKYFVNRKKADHDRTKVKQNKKGCMEFTGMYVGQEIQAHKGFICAMKFSPDGRYLATGGEDGVVRIWRVASIDASSESITSQCSRGENCSRPKKPGVFTKKVNQVSVVIPEKIFRIEESPVHEFQGHESDILDLTWSHSNMLLSSSSDKTVRLWRVGCSDCLDVFRHPNYVTCVQFNPVDENKFITGSIDGKVRVWGITEKRVVDWADARDIISAICYQPDGTGFVVGSITGSCRFYQYSGNELELELEAEIRIRSRKRSGNRITGIQFSQWGSHSVMISSEDSKLRIFDGLDLVQKFKGFPNSRSQLSASFTSAGRHIVSVGEDSRVYLWNYDDLRYPISKHIKSVRSCEHFLSEDVSVAIPWSPEISAPNNASPRILPETGSSSSSASQRTIPQRFSLGNWLTDVRSKGSSATWPEEKLPPWDVDYAHQDPRVDQSDETMISSWLAPAEAWGLVIVTATWDGTIRTYHNYGLPVILS